MKGSVRNVHLGSNEGKRLLFTKQAHGSLMLQCLISIGLFAVMLSLALQTYVLLYKALETQGMRASLLAASRELLHQLRRDVRCARAAPSRFRQWQAGKHTLILLLPSVSTAEGEESAWVVYQSEPKSKRVTRYFFPQRDSGFSARSVYAEPLGTGISQVSFSVRRAASAASLVEMRIAHRQTVHRRPVSINLYSAVVMRNG